LQPGTPEGSLPKKSKKQNTASGSVCLISQSTPSSYFPCLSRHPTCSDETSLKKVRPFLFLPSPVMNPVFVLRSHIYPRQLCYPKKTWTPPYAPGFPSSGSQHSVAALLPLPYLSQGLLSAHQSWCSRGSKPLKTYQTMEALTKRRGRPPSSGKIRLLLQKRLRLSGS